MLHSRVRRTLLCLAATALPLGGVVVAGSPASGAAPCDPITIGQASRSADAAFTAAIDSSEVLRVAGEQMREVTMTVDLIFQGTIRRERGTVVMPPTLQPAKGDQWLFFVDGEGPQFTVQECSGSRRATARVDEQVELILGAGEAYVDPNPPRPPLAYEELDPGSLPPLSRMVAPGAGLALIALLGLLVTRRRH